MNKKLKITVDGVSYNVEIEVLDSNAQAAAAPAQVAQQQAPQAAASGDGAVLSPLSAVVVSVDVSAGQSVKEGDKLFTLEAMKMNTFVFAPKAGTVSQIMVSKGENITEGQPLANIQ